MKTEKHYIKVHWSQPCIYYSCHSIYSAHSVHSPSLSRSPFPPAYYDILVIASIY